MHFHLQNRINLNSAGSKMSDSAMDSSPIRTPSFRFWRATECAALFLGIPTIHALGWLPIHILLLLIVMGGACWLLLRFKHEAEPRDLATWPTDRGVQVRTLVTYAVAIPFLYAVLWLFRPGALFSLVSHRPGLWIFIIFAYPLVSVFPQELMYRLFFFRRYRCLFGTERAMVLASAVAFSYGHIVFHNWVAVALTAVGGLIFGQTYRLTRSIPWTAIEHSLYGGALFTLGYGEFLVGGMLQAAR